VSGRRRRARRARLVRSLWRSRALSNREAEKLLARMRAEHGPRHGGALVVDGMPVAFAYHGAAEAAPLIEELVRAAARHIASGGGEG
jgi:hypothetical protein